MVSGSTVCGLLSGAGLYNGQGIQEGAGIFVACSQAWIQITIASIRYAAYAVVAALRHGLVTMPGARRSEQLWLALRRWISYNRSRLIDRRACGLLSGMD